MALDFEKLDESPYLLDILIEIEDVLDSLDMYVFKNWFKGEIVSGPIVQRYWLDITLQYAANEMPDPRAALRLIKHKIRVDFKKSKLQPHSKNGKGMNQIENGVQQPADPSAEGPPPKKEADYVWLVNLSIPRRLVVQINSSAHDFYDDEVDIDQVEDAKDAGLDDESGYFADEQAGMPDDQSEIGT